MKTKKKIVKKIIDADDKPGFVELFNKKAPKYFKQLIKKDASGSAS